VTTSWTRAVGRTVTRQFIATFLCTTAAAAQTWQALPNAPVADSRHEDVWFTDPLHGCVVNLAGAVHRTSDGGVSWSTTTIPNGFLRCVAFADTLRGWAGALSPIVPLRATADGGVTWTPVDIQGPRVIGLCGLWVVGDSIVVGTGMYAGWPRFVRSVDGGRSWHSRDLTPWARTLVDCRFFSADSGFVVGSDDSSLAAAHAVVLWTGDGGASWERRHLGVQVGQWAWKITFPTRNVGYVSLESFEDFASFLKTTDGGAHWSEGTFVRAREQGIGFATELVGWIGGSSYTVYGTHNGGVTWERDDFGAEVNSFHMLSDVLGYAVGKTVYKYAQPTAVERRTVTAVKRLYR
jgi:photosystem II stability/assembly factor-like uncharacterized protein